MDIRPLAIDGAWEITPRQFPDGRGLFLEAFRGDRLAEVIGHRPGVIQSNISVSSRGSVRGVHYADVPPSQAKYVTAVSGAFLDVVVDIRVGSPTFGQYDVVRLDTTARRAVYLSEGLGHAVVALDDNSTLVYLVSATYAPEREHGVNPLDPALALPWPGDLELVLSEKDKAAPTLAEAQGEGRLPSYDDCLAHARQLRSAR